MKKFELFGKIVTSSVLLSLLARIYFLSLFVSLSVHHTTKNWSSSSSVLCMKRMDYAWIIFFVFYFGQISMIISLQIRLQIGFVVQYNKIGIHILTYQMLSRVLLSLCVRVYFSLIGLGASGINCIQCILWRLYAKKLFPFSR